MSAATPVPGIRLERQDQQRLALAPEERDRLGHAILIRLADCAHGVPLRHLIRDHDEFELRAAASRLVESGYARWVHWQQVAITDAGLEAVETIRSLTTPS